MKRKAWIASISLVFIVNSILIIFIDSIVVQIALVLLALLLQHSIWVPFQEFKTQIKKNQDLLAEKELLRNENIQKDFTITKLNANEKQLKNIIEKMNALVFILDKEGNLDYISNDVASFFNLDNKTIFNGIDLLEDHIHPDDKVQFTQDKHKWGSGQSLKKQYRIMINENNQRWIEVQVHSSFDTNGNIENIYGTIIDITNHKKKEEKLSEMAFFDVLTGLPNRVMLKTQLRKALSRARRKKHDVTIMFMDLDGFKAVNDNLGHDVGDELLKEVANRLNESVREEDLVSRIGGDEFIIMIEETAKEEVVGIANRILREMSVPYPFLQKETTVTPSIGIATYPTDGENMDTLVEDADKAMYFAKNKGKNNFQFFTPELEEYELSESVFEKVLSFFQK